MLRQLLTSWGSGGDARNDCDRLRSMAAFVGLVTTALVGVTAPAAEYAMPVVPTPAEVSAAGQSVAISGSLLIIGAPFGTGKVAQSGVAYVHRYDTTVKNWVFEAALQRASGQAGEDFGRSVAIDHVKGLAFVGAPGVTASGLSSAGVVAIFKRTVTGAWSIASEVESSVFPRPANGRFGHSVSVSGNTLVVGEPGSGGGQIHQVDFDNDGGNLSYGAVIVPTGAVAEDECGSSVALADDRLAVGCPGRTVAGQYAAGLGLVYRSNGSSWNEKLEIDDDPRAGARLGTSVALTSVAGTYRAVFGSPNYRNANDAPCGCVRFAFEVGASWHESSTFLSPGCSAGDFGYSVALSSTHLLVGAPGASVPGVFGPVGIAMLFSLTAPSATSEPAIVTEVMTFRGAGAVSSEGFGTAVTLDGQLYAVGAPNHMSAGSIGRAHAFASRCGDGVFISTKEGCDDGDNGPLDGCDNVCSVETGWVCAGSPSVCKPFCGDGALVGPEPCDDGGTASGNGCSSTCQIEPGWTCAGAPSSCTFNCLPGACDDSNPCTIDTCSATSGCNAAPQTGLMPCYSGPPGSKGLGACTGGTTVCLGGLPGPCLGETLPALEVCDGIDNDCNTAVDDGLPGVGAVCDGPDADQCKNGVRVCAVGSSGGGAVLCAESAAAAWWTFDGVIDGTIRDDSAHGNDAIVVGPGVTLSVPAMPGSLGVAFAGKGGRLDAGTANLIGGKVSATWTAWIKPKSIADGLAVVVATHAPTETGVGRTWAFGRSGRGLFLRLRNGTNTNDLPPTVVCDADCERALVVGEWHHVAAVWSGGVTRFYIDGIFSGGAVLPGLAIAGKLPAERITIGGTADGELGSFDGGVDDVRVYPIALSDAEIALEAARGQGKLVDLCDGLDDDCDGQVDEEFTAALAAPCDGPDSDKCRHGVAVCSPDGRAILCPTETKTDLTESCDGLDNDCDGQVDEDFPNVGAACIDTPTDGDADACNDGIVACAPTGEATKCYPSPTHLWRFDEGQGAVAIDTASQVGVADFELTGATWGPGRFGQAAVFDGLGSFGAVNVSLPTSFTLELWAKTNATTPGTLYTYAVGNSVVMRGALAGGQLTHHHSTLSGGATAPSGAWSAGQWHHVAVTASASAVSVWIDGAIVGTAALSGPISGTTLYLGKSPTGSEYLSGSVDEVALLPDVWPAVGIVRHFTAGIPVADANRELCDGLDNDCLAGPDDTLLGAVGTPCDGADEDGCKDGSFTCNALKTAVECVNEATVGHTEICNAKDDDCDGATDEGFTWYEAFSDATKLIGEPCKPQGECGLGKVECLTQTQAACSTGPGGSLTQAKAELCDLKDNDCDGLTDENPDGTRLTVSCYSGPAGTEGVGACKPGARLCLDSGALGPCAGDVLPKAADTTCDLVDDDCNGVTDDGYKDAIACTVDTCLSGVAKSTPDDTKCDDKNPCTDDTCGAVANSNGGCVFTIDDTNTPDPVVHGKPCKKPVCTLGKVVLIDDPGSVPDDGLSCTSDVCKDGLAVHPLEPGTCLINGACYAATTVNPSNGCQVCAPDIDTVKWSKYVHLSDFDKGGGNADGWTAEELQYGGVSWGLAPYLQVTGTSSFYFGNGATRTYDTGARVAATAKSPTFIIPASVKGTLTFHVWMDTEGYTGSEKYDTLTLSVVESVAGTKTTVWDSMHGFGNQTGKVFKKIVVDLSPFSGKSIQLAFTFDSGDAYFNDYEGVYLDRVRVETACCTSSVDCDDGLVCTQDSCFEKSCLHTQLCSDCVSKQHSVVLLLDRSETMVQKVATGETQWQALRNALGTVLPKHDQSLNVGLKVFPTSDPLDVCAATTGLDVDFHSTSSLMIDFLNATQPLGQSPVAAGLNAVAAAYATPTAKAQGGAKVVILVSDGVDSCAGDVKAAIAALGVMGIRVIVLAWDTATTKAVFTEWALAGGFATPRSNVLDKVYTSLTDAVDLAAALDAAMTRARAEVCDGTDDDCNLSIDDKVPAVACELACNGGLGGKRVCSNGKLLGCSEAPTDERCNSLDDDCDGKTDENWPDLGAACSVGGGNCVSTGKFVCHELGLDLKCSAPPKPGVVETCDKIDNDCDGEVDEGLVQNCKTACGIGVEKCAAGVYQGCTAPPPKTETCNQVDDDCNGTIDDITPVACTGPCGPGFAVCVNGAIGPCSAEASTEVCDGKDNDCDGKTDEALDNVGSLKQACAIDGKTGPCAQGFQTCAAGQFGVCNAAFVAQPEICDGKDNDCNAIVDDGFDGSITEVCYEGAAATKGVGECKAGTRTCVAGQLNACVGQVLPVEELCNGLDDDCDGLIDEQPGAICTLEPGCAPGFCLCNKGGDGQYRCYLD